MGYDDFKESFREAWKDSYKYFVLIDLKSEIKEDLVLLLREKIQTECTPATKPFWLS